MHPAASDLPKVRGVVVYAPAAWTLKWEAIAKSQQAQEQPQDKTQDATY